MLRMRPPKIPEKFPPVLTTEDLQKLIAACKGPGCGRARRSNSQGLHRHGSGAE